MHIICKICFGLSIKIKLTYKMLGDNLFIIVFIFIALFDLPFIVITLFYATVIISMCPRIFI